MISDDLLRKVYKFLACLWLLASVLMAIAVTINQRNMMAGVEFFLFMLYPYYAIFMIYILVGLKYRSLRKTKEKWMQDGGIKVVASFLGERVFLFFFFVFSFIPYFYAVMFVRDYIGSLLSG